MMNDSKPVRDLKGRKVMVLHGYTAVHPDELNLKPGQVVDVLGEVCDGWWRGVLGGREGVFPNNFVELISQYLKPTEPSANHTDSEIKGRRAVVFYEYLPADEDELYLKPGEMVDVLGEECEGWWKGVVVGQKKKEGVFPDNFVELLPKITTDAASFPAVEVKDRRAVVYFSYEAQDEDELTISPGQVVHVLDKGEEGWLKGELEGKEGVFPDNFVELIPLYEPSFTEENIQYKQRGDFPTDVEYSDYVKQTLRPGMRVRARQDIGSVSQGELGVYFQQTHSVAGPALFTWDKLRKARRAHWTDVEILSGKLRRDSRAPGDPASSSDAETTDQTDGQSSQWLKLQCDRARCEAEQAKHEALDAKKQAKTAEIKAEQAESKAMVTERRVLEADRRAQLADQRAQAVEKAVQEALTLCEQVLKRAEAAERRAEAAERHIGSVEALTRRIQELERSMLNAQSDPQEKPFWAVQRQEIQITNEEIGRGGWGAIVVALFRGQRVAAKTLHNQIISPHNLRLFTREMNMAARVRHPNLLQFIGATTEGEPIILTELMHTSLRNVLGINPLSWTQVMSIFSDVVRALNYLHLMQPSPIIHRDISSANVLLEPSSRTTWKAKVSDFGSTNFVSQVSTTGPGNPLYAAPEAYNPYKQSPKMDVFSCGILFIETCTRQLPPVDEREQMIGQIPWPVVVPLVRQCIQEDKDKRPTMKDILERLDLLSGQM